MACTGIEFCKLAIVETKARGAQARRRARAAAADFDEPLTINVNGCPNSCARIQVADIGLKGMLVTDADGDQVEGFQVHLGGGLGLDAGFGRKVRGHKVTADELPDYVERVVRNFDEQRRTGERFAQWVARADEARSLVDDASRARGALLLPVLRRRGPAPARGRARRLALPVLHPGLQPEARRIGCEDMTAELLSLVPLRGRRARRARRAPHGACRAGPPGGSRTRPPRIIRWAARTFG